ncbi:MAG TPA: hypothetical protein VGH89_34755, partial [Pseudonocardia sp.]
MSDESVATADRHGVKSGTRSSAITAGFQPGRFALRDTWFALVHSRQVGRRPVRRVIHGEPVYLVREGAHAVAYEDSPRDRDRGRRRRGEFTGGSGRWLTLERYGYVWVWYGDPENASEELVPHLPVLPEGGMPRY